MFSEGKLGKTFWIRSAIAATILFVVLVGAGFVSACLTRAPEVHRDGLYGVFLTNGQVYFGTISSEDKANVVLKDIYYIQLKDGQAATQQSDVSLLKLGNELHGPEDWMEINREHILFIEKLKSDGKVAKAIDAYKQK